MKKLKIMQSVLLSKNISFAVIVIAFAVWPLPGIEDGPTGFQLFHNHATERLGIHSQAIANNREVTAQNKAQAASQWKTYLIEGLIMQTEESTKLSPEVKASRLRRFENELKTEKEKLDGQSRKLYELEGDWTSYGFAIRPRSMK